MVKGNPKSSASSSTRKKHAKKALGPADQPDTLSRDKKPKAKEKGKGASKREARVKMYIPPTKPAPVQPDPLDAMRLAHRLPPELLVVLRSLGKKAEVTKVRALEDLQAHWVERCDDDAVLYAVTDMLPVWMHHIPTLFAHPARRIRLLAASIHASFLALAPLNTHISAFLADSAPTPQLEAILGTWCLAAHDIDKAVAATAAASWTPFIARASPLPPPAALARTFEFCQSMLLDPLGTYTYLNPPQPAAPPPPSAPHARAKMAGRNAHGSGRQTPVRQREDPDAARREDEHEETETDRKARLRVAAFGAIGWLLSHQPPTPEHAPVPTEDSTHIDATAVHALLANPALWTALAHDNSVSVCPAIDAFGRAQPPVRRAAWAFVDALLRVRARAQTQGKGKGKRDYIGVQAQPQRRSETNEEPEHEPHEESQIQPERQPDTDAKDAKEGRGGGVLGVLSAALLRAPWADPDPGVRAAMWGPLLTFLRAFPEAWALEARFGVPGEGDEGSDDEEEQDYDDDKEGQDGGEDDDGEEGDDKEGAGEAEDGARKPPPAQSRQRPRHPTKPHPTIPQKPTKPTKGTRAPKAPSTSQSTPSTSKATPTPSIPSTLGTPGTSTPNARHSKTMAKIVSKTAGGTSAARTGTVGPPGAESSTSTPTSKTVKALVNPNPGSIPESDTPGTVAPPPVSPASPASQAYRAFLQFVAHACGGAPVQGYPAVLVVLASVPLSIMAASSPAPSTPSTPPAPSTPSPLSAVTQAFWAAVDARALSSGQRGAALAAGAAFLEALLECVVFLARRVHGRGRGKEGERALLLGTPANNSRTNDSSTPNSSDNNNNNNNNDNKNTVMMEDSHARLGSVVAAQFVRALREIAGGRVRVDARRAGGVLARGFGRLRGVDAGGGEGGGGGGEGGVRGRGWYGDAWAGFSGAVAGYFPFGGEGGGGEGGEGGEAGGVESEGSGGGGGGEACRMVVDVLKALYDSAEGEQREDARRLIAETAMHCVAGTARQQGGADYALLALLDAFGGGLWTLDSGVAAGVDGLVADEVGLLVERAPEVLRAYLRGCPDEGRVREVWGRILGKLCQQSLCPQEQDEGKDEGQKDTEEVLKLLRPWIDAAKRGALPACIRHPKAPATDAVDGLISRVLGDALQGPAGGTDSDVLVEVFAASDYFVSEACMCTTIDAVTASIAVEVDLMLRDREADMRSLGLRLRVLDAILKTDAKPMLLEETPAVALAPSLALFVYLLPLCLPIDAGERKLAADLYAVLVASDHAVKERAKTLVLQRLRELLADSESRPSYEDVLAASAGSFLGDEIDFMRDVAPSQVELDALLGKLAADPPHASLAVIDPLVPPESFFQGTDAHFRAPAPPCRSYVALVSAILQHHLDNPRLISERVHLWTLRHFVALAVYAGDALGVPYAEGGVFAGAVGREEVLAKIVRDVEGVMRAVFVGEQTGAWRRGVLEAVQANSVQTLDGLPRFVAEMVMLSTEKETIRESRVLHRVLKYVLDDAIGSEEADLWVGLARKLEKLAPLTSLVIITAISSVGVDSPRLDRYRNELAASVTGVRPPKADTDGLVLLRKLVAIAPPPDSDVVFLPQHRAVNLVKACQQWATSDDEDIGEEVECLMTEVFVHAAPILQNVPGAHWEFVFDVVESNVETCSVGDASTLVTLAATVRLVSAIEDLSSTNRALRGVWQARRTAVFKALRDMASARLPIEEASLPRSVCLEALLTLLQELPDALIDSTTFAHMTHLLDDGSCEVQKLAYQLLQKAAKKHTEHLVIEAGVDSDGVVKAELPAELLDILGIEISAPDRDGHSARVFTHLLGWMVVFDLFVDASLKVRSAYVEQLRDRGIISTYFIPNIFDLLRLPEGIARAFKLDAWAVDEFYVQYYDEGVPGALSVLGAHLYYRALLTIPSLVYSWVLDCKDRQLSSAIASYTSSYFSPVIIRAELAHVRDSTPELSDDAFKVKVSSNVSEVTASYIVDDQELEIKLKIPTDWPLHRIEVRDSKTVGVDDRRWRAWILGIQQTLWSLNGHVIDGLSVFKKNVALHFEGQVECAICYSIINVTDGSLPKKPCNTCKNRFHAGCLYKWFSSSHSSSCPLCRSDII